MASDEPAYLSKGVEVSAKYRGAFCEAKVTHVEKSVKCKVILKEDSKHIVVSDDDIKGIVKVGATVEVRKPDTGQYVEAVVSRVNDHSLYTVVFDDGDQETLRRSKLCLKGDRHFMKSETLDDLPLTNPEHFGTPVIRKTSANKSAKNNTASESDESSEASDSSGDESDSRSGSQSKSVSNEREYAKPLQDFVGQVICIETEDRSRKSTTIPVLVVLSTADDLVLPSSNHLLVKSFKDNKFLTTALDASRLFSTAIAAAKTAACKDKMVKFAWDKAQQYFERQELPASWDREQLLGNDVDSDEMSDCEVPPMDERRDRFIAQLYKFMEDRGTPLNKSPTLENFDLDLFHMFLLVTNMGGYNRVNNSSRWSSVYLRMKLACSLAIGAAAKLVRESYEKYLHAYEDFNRKLGCTLVSTTGRPERGRHPSSRSLLSFRDRSDRLSDGGGKSVSRTSGKRLTSVKEESSTGAKTPGFEKLAKEESVTQAAKEADDIDKSEKSDSKADDTTRSTRKTPKRSQGETAKVPVAIEPKTGGDDTSRAKESTDLTNVSKKIGPEMEKLVRQRRPSAIIRLTRGDVVKTKAGAASPTVSVFKEDRTSKKSDSCSGSAGDDRPERKPVSNKSAVSKEEVLSKKKSDNSDSAEDKKSSKIDSKRTDNARTDKSLPYKRPLSRRTSAADPSAGRPSSEKAPGPDVSGTPGAESNAVSKEDDRESKTAPSKSNYEEGHAIGTRLSVKYGKGTNQKTYEAKVIDKRTTSGILEYLVHYAGWNNRYDEWIRRDVIMRVLEEPNDPPPLTVPVTNVVNAKSRQPSTHRSIIAQAAEKKKTTVGPIRPSSESSSVLKASKIRRPGEGGGGDSEDSAKSQKKPSSLEANRSHTKQTPAKGRHRRTRTRSRTIEAGDSELDSASSSDESASDSEGKDSVAADSGEPSSTRRSTTAGRSSDELETEKKMNEASVTAATSDTVDSPKPLQLPGSADKKDFPTSEKEMRVVLTANIEAIGAAVEPKVECQSSEGQRKQEEAGIDVNSSVDIKRLNSGEALAIVEHNKDVSRFIAEPDEPRSLAAENLSTDKELTMSEDSALEMPDLTKFVDEDSNSNTDVRMEEKPSTSRGKKRPSAAEPLEKNEKKMKSDGKKKVREEIKDVDEKNDSIDELESDSGLKSRVEDKKDDKPPELSISENVERGDEIDSQVDIKPNIDDIADSFSEDLSNLKSSKAKKKQSTDEKKTNKVANSGKSDDKKEYKGKKKIKAGVAVDRLLETSSQDSAASECESSQDKDLGPAIEDDKPLVPQVPEPSVVTVPDEKTVVSSSVAATSADASEKVTNQKACDDTSTDTVARCGNAELDISATDSKSECRTSIEAAEKCDEGVNSSDCYRNVCDESAMSAQSNQRQVAPVEDTLSLLRPNCPQTVPTYTDSPPDTSCDEFGASASGGSASPPGPAVDADEEHRSTKSELEANMEVASYMDTVSNSDDDDDDSGEINATSLGNVAPRHGHTSKSGSSVKRKHDESRGDESFDSGKRKRKEKQPHQHHHRTRSNHNRLSAAAKANYKNQASDDEEVEPPVNTTSFNSSNISTSGSSHKISHSTHRSSIKYNFLDLEEGQYLEGEERIAFLMSKIHDLRQVYMELKAEVACIDRRRRRHRCKEREAQAPHLLANSSSVSSNL